MARAGLRRTFSVRGYDCELVKVKLPSGFLQTECSVCAFVLRTPHITSCCGQNLCKMCIESIHKEGKCCPVCKQGTFTSIYNRSHDLLLQDLEVNCPNSTLGCRWTGKLQALDEHISCKTADEQANRCGYVEVGCNHEGCEKVLQRRYLTRHQRKCPKRKYTCEYCHEYSSTHDDVSKHWSVCIRFPVSCPHGCTADTFERKNLDKHLLEDCALQEIDCSFAYAGCTTKVLRKHLVEHAKECLELHLSLLVQHNHRLMTQLADKDDQIASLLEENNRVVKEELEKLATDQQQKTDSVREQLTVKHQRDMDNFASEKKQTIEKLELDASSMKEKVKEISDHQDSLKSTVSAEMESWVNIVTQGVQAECNELESRVAKVESMLLKFNHHMGITPIQIIMPRFDQLKRDNRTWKSSGFYTHMHGYKVCLSVVPNGSGNARGTHVSCVINLMCGEFDNYLTWPFRGQFSIQLLNQRDDASHRSATVLFNEETVEKAAARVTSDEKSSLGWGYTLFISHDQLGYNKDENCQYLMHNTLYFQVTYMKPL